MQDETTIGTITVDADEWLVVIDNAAQFHLGITGREFTKRLHAGDYDDPDDGPDGLMAVLALVPDRE